MKKKKLRRISLLFFAISISSFLSIPIFNECLKNYPVILNFANIALLIALIGGFLGSIIVFFISLFNRKKYCYLCAAYYKNRFDVKNGELIEKKTNAKLHNEVIIHKLFDDDKKYIAVALIKQEQKYKSIEDALEILRKDNYVLQNIRTGGEFSSHDYVAPFSHEYSSVDELKKCANDDFDKEKKNTAAEIDWSTTIFTVKNKYTDFKISFYYGEHSDSSHLSAFITKDTKSRWDDVAEKLSSLIGEKTKSQTDIENKKTPDNGSAYKFKWNTIIAPKEENLKKGFTPNINNLAEPIYFANGIMSENEIHIGSYWLNSWDYEQVTIKKADDAWYVCSVAMWPVHRGASNGGYTEIKLEKEYFKRNAIKNTDDFLKEFLKGSCNPCIKLAKNSNEIVDAINDICKNLYVETDINYKDYNNSEF